MVIDIHPPMVKSGNYLDFSSFFNHPEEKMTVTAGISLAAAGSLNPFRFSGRKARKFFFNHLGFSGRSVGYCRQIHSRKVLVLDRKVFRGPRADGMVTSGSSILLTVTAADCMPVFLYDPENGVLGLCHSGWQGTGIAAEAVRLMEQRFGTRTKSLIALLGPAIGSCCYKVDSPRAEAFQLRWGAETVVKRGDDLFLDMKTANIRLLESLGVESVFASQNCTVCDTRLGSFRREGPENYTRMTAFLGFLPSS